MPNHGHILWRLAFDFLEIGSNSAAEILGLANIDDLFFRIRKMIYAR